MPSQVSTHARESPCSEYKQPRHMEMQSYASASANFKGMSRALLAHGKPRAPPLRGAAAKVAMANTKVAMANGASGAFTLYGDEGGRVFADLAGAGVSDLAEAANQLAAAPTAGRAPQKRCARVEVGKACFLRLHTPGCSPFTPLPTPPPPPPLCFPGAGVWQAPGQRAHLAR